MQEFREKSKQKFVDELLENPYKISERIPSEILGETPREITEDFEGI